MKIAIPTNDRKTLAERSGRASEFAIINFDAKGVISLRYITNSHEDTHHGGGEQHRHGHGGGGHGHGVHNHGHGDIVALLKGVDMVVGKKFGPHFARDFHDAGIKMKLTKLDIIDDVVKSIEL